MFNLFEQLKTTVKALKALIDYKFNILDKRIFNILHDEESEMITTEFSELTWDGNTEGLTNVSPDGNTALCLIYDNPPTFEEASAGGQMIISILQNGEMVDEVLEYTTENVVMGNDNLYTIDDFCLVVLDNNAEFQGFVFPKKGIYFASVNIPSEFVMLYVKSLSINNYIFSSTEKVVTTPLKQIDKKYIPGGVADWNVNDSTASGYIENRPFYDAWIKTEKVSGSTITWDFNVDGLETDSDGHYCRVSSTVLPEHVFESDITVSMDGYSETYSGYNKLGDIIFLFDGAVAVALKDNADDGDGLVLPKAGIYFSIFEGPSESEIAITFSGYNGGFDVFKVVNPLKKIDKKFLPRSIGKAGIGYNAEIFNDYSDNRAYGDHSHAEGYYTTASGYVSHAEGDYTTASGIYSHAEGSFTTASGEYQHVQGKFNIEDTENKYAHIVGNGTYSKRSNIHTVDWEGNAWFARDVYTGGTGQDDPNAKKLATEEYVDTNIKDYFLMKDAVTGSTYVVQIKNGQFTITPKLVKITVTTPPTKTDYTDTELFDPTGMVVMAEYENGTTEEITNYTYDKYVTTGSSEFVIRYTSGGMTCEDSISITTRTIEEALVDFEYTTNDDGTYTITGWKGTYNGVETTECILPNSDLINID